jgi:hypothetical protein
VIPFANTVCYKSTKTGVKQATSEKLSSPTIEVIDKAARSPLESRKFVLGLSLAELLIAFTIQKIPAPVFHNLNPRGTHAKQLPVYFGISH